MIRLALRRLGGPIALALLVACGSDATAPTTPSPPAPPGAIVFLVGTPTGLNGSEVAILEVLRTLDREVRVLDDDGFEPGDEGDCDLVVVGKSVTSGKIANKLVEAGCGVFTWEDDQQRIDMLALVSGDGGGSASWHTRGQRVWIHDEVPRDLRAALAGSSDFYVREAEISYAPEGTLTSGAVVIADLAAQGGRPVVYVVDRGARLANGSRAAGRRAFFGLHHDTYRHLTPAGRALFEATIRWTLGE